MAEAEGLEAGKHSGTVLQRVLAMKQRLRAGKTIIGAWLGLTDPAAAEILGRMGFDFVIADTEHGAWNIESLQRTVMALNGSDTVPIARVPWNDHVYIKQALDLGIEGIMAPMVNSVEECRALVAACKYPPAGRRGSGPKRASNYYRDAQEYFAVANDAIFVMPQIESVDTVGDINSYVAVPGIDAIAIGPNDMSGTAGVFGNRKHPKVQGAIDKIAAAAKAAGIPVFLGINTPPSEQRELVGKGFRILTVANDFELLVVGARDALAATKAVLTP
jgi:2-keto-3-deoxy-L-rhamnonate aldolase RhmA